MKSQGEGGGCRVLGLSGLVVVKHRETRDEVVRGPSCAKALCP